MATLLTPPNVLGLAGKTFTTTEETTLENVKCSRLVGLIFTGS